MEEKKRDDLIKKFLFIGIVALLFIPMFSNRYKLFEIKPLGGSYSQAEDPKFAFENWFEGVYQDQKQNYIEESLIFKPLFVRIYNQYYHDFYNIGRANSVVVGKSGYLYESYYIKAYLGRDFIGDKEIQAKVKKLSLVVDTLKSKGVELIVVFAPGKGSFYSEFIPEKFNPNDKTITNYEVYNEKLLKSSIHYLDFRKWFLSKKSTSKYPLFPKTGIHWSKYGELLAADSLLRYINSISQFKKTPELIIGEVEVSNIMRDTDDDIEKGMNLYYDIPDLEMGYPVFSIHKEKINNQPKVLTISDSYYWGMFNWGLSKKAFNNGQFWYYNEAIYPDSYEKPIKVSDINIIDEVEKNDIVILMSTDAYLYKFAFGFIDQLYAAYFPPEVPTK
ncbi:hypothetical protein ERX46_11505 [Brumimicrobium glaciale]|uniref:AlgX/AlgJ SGNH hydrolase-like domain-containing protein n=1 Tax=Brumimicrobium glaciale TaxID=200475 RepID=A0A4V1WFK9_9FLAO|nr:hypothetical protein [Brumimicrobium glaciale]RYM33556.1 hypothetical protein ERX46_11505 [Brumimicrobium glaciale]